ncbi:MAG: ABC transporter permease [Oscillospiraceae bacterium]|nr:ABC transporter permease [Oscillospiraceae bacterium]
MNKIFLLARANIRKTKGQTVILAILFLISSMMLNAGLIVLFSFGSFFERLTEELNTSDAYIYIPEVLYTDEVEQYLQTETLHFQKNSGIMADTAFEWKGEPFGSNMVICDIDEPRSISQWKYISDSLPQTADAIYVPYGFKIVGGYHLGDTLKLTLAGTDFRFTVAGYTECIFQDRMFTGDVVFVPGARFRELSAALSDYRKVLVFANGESYAKIEAGLLEMTGSMAAGYGGDLKYSLFGTDSVSVKTSRTSMPAMISAMMVVFTAVIAVVCLLVIRFRISNSIEEDMPKIGSLQSVGYTSRQITFSIVTQYGLIALTACLLGVIPAYLALPFIGDVFAQQSGLYWAPDMEPVINLAAVGALTLIVIAVSLLAAAKIRKISPVRALRGGILTHSFKKNHIPLEKTRLPLTAALSGKSILQGLRQSITMFVIVLSVSFTAVVAMVLYYNAAVDLEAFEKVPGIERANASVVFLPDEDPELMRREILSHRDVRKAQYVDFGRVRVDGEDVGVGVMSDFSEKETVNVYKGIFPRYDNEIAIAGLFASMLGKNIGDEVLLGKDDLPYLITGLSQGMESGSAITVYLTLDGMRRIQPDFTQSGLMVYLSKGTDTAAFVEEMEALYEGRLISVANGDVGFAEGVSAFANIVSLVGMIILIIAGCVIILVLYFVIGTTIIRKRRELGIQKAVGYTTVNLMNQITLSFTIPLLFGGAAGCVLGAAAINPFMSVGMAQMGVMKAAYIINPVWVAATGVCMIVLSYLTSIFITWRIRKISAYALVSE